MMSLSRKPKWVLALLGAALVVAVPMVPATASASLPAGTTATAGRQELAAVARPAGSFVPLKSARILDTRSGNGARGPVAAGGSVAVQVLGRGGVPGSGVSAVVVNVTAVGSTNHGFVSVYPNNTAVPGTTNLNFAKGQTIANLVTVAVGSDGRIRLRSGGSSGTVHLLADVSGYYTGGTPTAAGAFRAVTPKRFVDSRIGRGTVRGKVAAGATRIVQIAGAGGLPKASIAAVVIDVTAIGAAGAGSISVYPTDSPRPSTPVVNFGAGRDVTNLAVVPLWSKGKLTLYNSSAKPVDIVVDVLGYYLNTYSGQVGTFQSIPQQRVLDQPKSATTIGARQAMAVPLAGVKGIPNAGMSAVAVNVTVVNPGKTGSLNVYAGATRSSTSSLNFAPHITNSNLVVLPVVNGRIQVYNNSLGAVAIQVDIFGVFWDGSGAARCNAVPVDASGTAVTRWNPLVKCILAVLSQPQAPGNVADVDTMIRYESSGDPNAINRYDINWQEGHPSEGLIQVIRPTFDAWRSPLLANNLLNPAANLYAGLNYAIHRYGSIHNIPGLVSLRGGGPYKGYIASN